VAWHLRLACRVLAACAGLVILMPSAALAQLPSCQAFQGSKSDSPDPIHQGTDLTYTISVYGNLAGPCFVVEDPLPAATTFQSIVAPASWNCAVPPVGSNGTVICDTGVVTATANLTVVVRVDPGFSGTLSNVATIGLSAPPNCPPPAPSCTAATTTTVEVPVELMEFRVD
jgi:hypothetical protein